MLKSSVHNLAKGLFSACLLLSSGCVFITGPDCINEDRSVSAEAHLVDVTLATADTGRGFFSLSDERNHITKHTANRGVIYFASSTLPRASVTAVHIHATSNDALLFVFPMTPIGPDFVITQNFTNYEFPPGPASSDDLFSKVAAGQTYVDVHTGQQTPRLRGPLVNHSPGNNGWVHAYCS